MCLGVNGAIMTTLMCIFVLQSQNNIIFDMGEQEENVDAIDQEREIRMRRLREHNQILQRNHHVQQLRIAELEASKKQLVIDLANKKAAFDQELARRDGGK